MSGKRKISMLKGKGLFVLLGIGAFAAIFAAYAYDNPGDKLVPYDLMTTINVPGGLNGFDISWVDSPAGRYYLADRGNAAATPPVGPSIDVIDTKHNQFLYKISLTSAGNGVLTFNGSTNIGADQTGVLVVGTADSHALFIDLANPFATPLAVSTGGNHRADELAFDPLDEVIIIANDQDTPHPFVSFISTVNHNVLGTIVYDGSDASHPLSTGGIEQSVWNPVTQRFYISIPKTALNANGEIDEINATTMAITKIFPTSTACGARGGPAGLALIPGQHLIASCGDVLDIASGTVVNVSGVSGDEIWFNPGDDRVYFGGGLDRISVNVVNALSPYDVITTLTVGLIATPPAPNHTTHSVAADSQLNRIYVPVSHEGVKVYTDDKDNGVGPKSHSARR
jgi:hypothetical protein